MRLLSTFTKPKVILFDIMETIVAEPFLNVMPSFFGLSRDGFMQQKDPHSWIEFEKGKIDEKEYFRSFFADRRTIDGPGLKAAMFNAYDWLPGMESLLKRLADLHYPMHALSNYAIWYQMIEEKLDISKYLQWTFVSCLTGYRKPDPNAYHHAASKLQLNLTDCLFIDDRSINVEAARSVGMQAIHFTGIKPLEILLAKHQIIL